MSTAHGNSCQDILARLEMMVLMGMDLPLGAIRQQIASGINIIVHLGRLPDRSRRVLEIAEIDGICDGQIVLSSLFQLKKKEKDWKLCKNKSLKHREKLRMAGLVLEEEFCQDERERRRD